MYGIKYTIPVKELTHDNMAERYQRCNSTEWGIVVTRGPDEVDAIIRAPPATKVVVPGPEETAGATLANVVGEVGKRSIGAQQRMANIIVRVSPSPTQVYSLFLAPIPDQL